MGGEKHQCRLWDNGIIRDLRHFLPALEQTKAGRSETVDVPIAASSVSFSSGAKKFDTKTKLSSSSGENGGR